jgi:hypothetical protein
LAGAEGFNEAGAVWDEEANELKMVNGYLNHPDHRACQFGRGVEFNNGRHEFSYAYYSGGIQAMMQVIEIQDEVGGPTVIHHGNAEQIGQVDSDQVLDNSKIDRSVIAGRIYSLGRMRQRGDVSVAEAPIFDEGKAKIKFSLKDNRGDQEIEMLLEGGNFHRVVGDVAIVDIDVEREGESIEQVEAAVVRSFRIPIKEYGDREAEEEIWVIMANPDETNPNNKWNNPEVFSGVVSDKNINLRRLFFGDVSDLLIREDGEVGSYWPDFESGFSGVWGENEIVIKYGEKCVVSKVYLPIVVKNQ